VTKEDRIETKRTASQIVSITPLQRITSQKNCPIIYSTKTMRIIWNFIFLIDKILLCYINWILNTDGRLSR
jgi:hypothetical protein